MTTDLNAFTMREACADDHDRLERLAALDSGKQPSGRVLLGEFDGELVAAAPIAGGPAIADPFKATSAFVSLLGLRAAQLRGIEERRESRPAAAAVASFCRPVRRRGAWLGAAPMAGLGAG
jgi:hypothetical protein